MSKIGDQMYELVRALFPIPRSLTGQGVRDTLAIIKGELPMLEMYEVPSGTQCFDWVVPKEWRIRDAYVVNPAGEKMLEFKKNNLHVVGYSTPVDQVVSLDELQNHLYSLPDNPDAIPYITSYYKERWGFCLSENQRKRLQKGNYRVVIDSELFDGSLTYGEVTIPGDCEKEVFLSTYICHPSMANNELSGPVVTTFIAKWLTSLKNRRYSYRIIFIPETIGSITYLSRHLSGLQSRVIAGFNVTCVGDDRTYSYLPSRYGNTLSDRIALHVLRHIEPEFVEYSYLDKGSDESQYCSPGVDLPICSVMRSKYGTFAEYHTSFDNLDFVTPSGLEGAYNVLTKCIECIEIDRRMKVTVLCDPQLGKRGLYPNLSTKDVVHKVKTMMNLIAYSDGTNTLLEIADIIGAPIWIIDSISKKLIDAGLLQVLD